MPTPNKGESKDDFIQRCIPIVIDDGTAEENKKEGENSMYFKQDNIERRYLPKEKLEVRTAELGSKIVGYAAMFNVWTTIETWWGSFKERIAKGSFAKTIKENDIRGLFNHKEDFVLGRNKAGTLRLNEDEKGLSTEIDIPPTTWANDLAASMKRGDITQMSFGFRVNKEEINYEQNERTLVDVTLFDVSVVTFPAYPTTTAEVRNAFGKKPEEHKPDFTELARLIAKIKSGQALTDDEIRALNALCPSIPPVPPTKHTEADPEPPTKHSEPDIRIAKDKVSQLLIRAEKLAPSKSI